MPVPQLNRRLLPFFIGVPLVWAAVLIFHPAPDPDHIHGSLQDEVTQWLVVPCLTLIFIGLMGAALYLLVRDLAGTAAKISRIAVGPFVLFYGAGEAILGIAVRVLVQYANAESPAERGAAVDAAQLLWTTSSQATCCSSSEQWRGGWRHSPRLSLITVWGHRSRSRCSWGYPPSY